MMTNAIFGAFRRAGTGGRRGVAGALASVFISVLGATPAAADSLRCGRSLVTSGDTAAEVREACGEPRATESGTLERPGLGKGKSVKVSRWRYHLGKGRYEGIVVFYRGEVVAVERGARR